MQPFAEASRAALNEGIQQRIACRALQRGLSGKRQARFSLHLHLAPLPTTIHLNNYCIRLLIDPYERAPSLDLFIG
jgi:hypothetical protein